MLPNIPVTNPLSQQLPSAIKNKTGELADSAFGAFKSPHDIKVGTAFHSYRLSSFAIISAAALFFLYSTPRAAFYKYE